MIEEDEQTPTETPGLRIMEDMVEIAEEMYEQTQKIKKRYRYLEFVVFGLTVLELLHWWVHR